MKELGAKEETIGLGKGSRSKETEVTTGGKKRRGHKRVWKGRRRKGKVRRRKEVTKTDEVTEGRLQEGRQKENRLERLAAEGSEGEVAGAERGIRDGGEETTKTKRERFQG